METNSKKHISISLFRVSADSKYLDMIFSCPREYYFDSLTLEVRFISANGTINSQNFDLSVALFNVNPESEEYNRKHWTVRLPLSKIGIEVPAIYKAVLKAQEIVEQGETANELEAFATCSDVNYAYRCMLNDLLSANNISDPCVSISDEAIRKYLLLYGHQAALTCGDDETAERYFKLIGNCFDICGASKYNCGCSNKQKSISTNCNCGK